MFGREDRGLSNDELLLSQRVIQLHSHASYPSLNLSHAVAVVLHELERLRRGSAPNDSQPSPAGPSELEPCLKDAEALLLEVGFLLQHTAHARMAKLRGLLQRAMVRSEEVALVRGMVRQLRWAIHRDRS